MLTAQSCANKNITSRGSRGRMAAGATIAAIALAGCGASGGSAAQPGSRPSTRAATARPGKPAATPTGSHGAKGVATGAGSQPATQAAAPLRSSCRAVVHIGDSTSDGLVLPAFQPVRRLRIPAQYRRVGVTHFINEVSGARSVVETWHGFSNAATVARQVLRRAYHGCWVLALGTNDTADVAVGSNIGLSARIREMMSLIGHQPVMWVNVLSLLHSGPYANAKMQGWDRALLKACPRYPNMRVYDWSAVARRPWFVPDGIHYTPEGYAHRARMIANALARAFPAAPAAAQPAVMAERQPPPPPCLVH